MRCCHLTYLRFRYSDTEYTHRAYRDGIVIGTRTRTRARIHTHTHKHTPFNGHFLSVDASPASNLSFHHNHPSFLGHEFMDDTYRGGNNFRRTLYGQTLVLLLLTFR